MRAFDDLFSRYADASPELKPYLLWRMEDLPMDFEGEDVMNFLAGVAAGEAGIGATQAQRTWRILLPSFLATRYRLRKPTSSTPVGTWTEYNLDRAEVDLLRRLGGAQVQDYSGVEMPRYLRSALHILSPLVAHAVDRVGREPASVALEAIHALGHLPTPEGVDALAAAVTGTPELVSAAAGALAAGGASRSFERLAQAFAVVEDPVLVGDIVLELRHVGTRDAYELVCRAADHRSPLARVGAAGALGAFGPCGAAGVLERLVRDPDGQVALWATEALGRCGDGSALSVLSKVLTEAAEPYRRLAALRGLAAHGDRRAVDLLLRTIGDGDPSMRALALEGLIRHRVPGRQIHDVVFHLMSDRHPEVAAHAALAVAPLDPSMASDRVKRLLADRDPGARAQGAWALGYIQTSDSLGVLAQAILRDPDEKVAVQAAKALGKYREADTADLLVRILKHPSPAVRQVAARLLGEFRDRRRAGEISGHVAGLVATESVPRVRAALVGALSRLVDPAGFSPLVEALEDPATDVVAAAAEGLDLLGNVDSMKALEPLLGDGRPAVKSRVALALWNQGEVRAIGRLAADADSDDPPRAAGALRALALILASLRHLDDASKYVLLFSELKANLRSPEFTTYEARVGSIDLTRRIPPRGARPVDYGAVTAPQPAAAPADDGAVPDVLAASHPGRFPVLRFEDPGRAGITEETGPAPRAAERDLALEEVIGTLVRDPAAARAALARMASEGFDPRVALLAARLEAPDDPAGALTLAQRAAAAMDGFAFPSLVASEAAQRLRDDRTSLRHFVSAVRTALGLLTMEVQLMNQVVESGTIDEVAPFARDLHRQLPLMAQAHAIAGELLYRRGRWDEAFEQLSMAHLADPANPAVAFLLARTAARLGRAAQARVLLRQVLDAPGADASLVERARDLLATL